MQGIPQDNVASFIDCAFQYNIHEYDEQLLITMQMNILHMRIYLGLRTVYIRRRYSPLHRPGLYVKTTTVTFILFIQFYAKCYIRT